MLAERKIQKRWRGQTASHLGLRTGVPACVARRTRTGAPGSAPAPAHRPPRKAHATIRILVLLYHWPAHPAQPGTTRRHWRKRRSRRNRRICRNSRTRRACRSPDSKPICPRPHPRNSVYQSKAPSSEFRGHRFSDFNIRAHQSKAPSSGFRVDRSYDLKLGALRNTPDFADVLVINLELESSFHSPIPEIQPASPRMKGRGHRQRWAADEIHWDFFCTAKDEVRSSRNSLHRACYEISKESAKLHLKDNYVIICFGTVASC